MKRAKSTLALLQILFKRSHLHGFYELKFRTCDEDFSPNRKNSSCQEMVGQYLRGCSMGNLVLGTGYWVLG